jgi:hypothetical protein
MGCTTVIVSAKLLAHPRCIFSEGYAHLLAEGCLERLQSYKTFSPSSPRVGRNKLECLSKACYSDLPGIILPKQLGTLVDTTTIIIKTLQIKTSFITDYAYELLYSI